MLKQVQHDRSNASNFCSATLRPIDIALARNHFPTSPQRVIMMALFEIVGLRNFILEDVGGVSPTKMADFRDE